MCGVEGLICGWGVEGGQGMGCGVCNSYNTGTRDCMVYIALKHEG